MKYFYGIALLAAGLSSGSIMADNLSASLNPLIFPLPSGSYKNSCTNCKWNPDFSLSCDCRYDEFTSGAEWKKVTKHTTKKGCQSYKMNDDTGDLECE